MSHVDDGSLHAYLDGETSGPERERLEAHLAGCAACQARLEEERLLIEHAGRLLDLVAPPERGAPPFQELRALPRRGGGIYRPLAWAATVVLAVGLGWYARGLAPSARAPGGVQAGATATSNAVAAAPAPVASAPAPAAPAAGETRRRDQAGQAARPAPIVDGQLVRREPARAEPAESAPAEPENAASLRLDAAAPRTGLRGQAAPVQAPSVSNVTAAAESRYDEAALHRLSTTWPVIEPKRARDVLGEEPALIPGYAVRALRSNPATGSEIVVEQVVDSDVVLLFERRGDAAPVGAGMAKVAEGRSAERLARYVRSLRVEIEGRLPAESLSALLDLVK